jgi:DNA-binding NtrC family response regulator
VTDDIATWFEEIAANEPVIARLVPVIRAVAASDEPALIVGEPGTGRELVARAIHDLSRRAACPFVEIDCADAGEAFLALELLGVDEGQTPHKIGAFEQARDGTILLGEVGELPLGLQQAALDCLDRGQVVRLRGGAPIATSARCLATSAADLAARVAAGAFREDLYRRLAAHVLRVPSLRERREDIPGLARHFLVEIASGMGRAPKRLSEGAEKVLRAYDWPGNIHQLREVVEHAALAAGGVLIEPSDFPAELRGLDSASLDEREKRHIEIALQASRGRIGQAAKRLGVSRWTLARRLKKHALPPPLEWRR